LKRDVFLFRKSELWVLTIQELCSSAKEEFDLELVGEEALMESTHALILCPPLISRFFKTLLLGMGM